MLSSLKKIISLFLSNHKFSIALLLRLKKINYSLIYIDIPTGIITLLGLLR